MFADKGKRIKFVLIILALVLTQLLNGAGRLEPDVQAADGSLVLQRPRLDPLVDPALRAQAQDAPAEAIIYLRALPDLSPAYAVGDKLERRQLVYDLLEQGFERSGGELLRWLEESGAAPQRLLAAHAIYATLDARLLEALAGRPEVASVTANRLHEVIQGTPAQRLPQPEAVEWNIAQIRADDVWIDLGITGQGAVIGEIDTGVQYDHPALVAQYRGNLGGSFDHNYNWYDFVSGSATPVDGVYHGTFGMGMAVGDDGGSNQIGVAPGAQWIAVRACDLGCTDADLLAAGDWMLAPYRLDGTLPDPSQAPDVVLSMWGGAGCNPWYDMVLQSWRAANILPVFSPGGSGPSCSSVGSPADSSLAFSAGATDVNDLIGPFSSRGPSACTGEIKPEVSAPGVEVRSSDNQGGYFTGSGTSWSAAHLAGLAGLLVSAEETLSVDEIETIIMESAVCIEDLSCGGTACPDGANNVYGWGRIDAFEAVLLATGITLEGQLQGSVTDAVTLAPIQNALVHAEQPDGGFAEVLSDPTGFYSLTLPVETYTVTVQADGYQGAVAAGVVISQGQVITQNFALTPLEADILVEPTTLSLTLVVSETGVATFTIQNLGDALLSYSIGEAPPVDWLAVAPATGEVAPAGEQEIEAAMDATGLLPGSYAAELLVASNDPDTPLVTVTAELTVLPLPCEPISNVTYSWTPLEPLVGTPVTFTASAAGTLPLTFTWDFEAGEQLTGTQVTHTFDLVGTHLVTLTVENECSMLQYEFSVRVLPYRTYLPIAPRFSFTPSRGVLDTDFDGDGVVLAALGGEADYAYAAALQPDGKLVVAGASGEHSLLARFNPDGSLDTSFGAGGWLTTTISIYGDAFRDVAVQADGKIVAAGGAVTYHETFGGWEYAFALARYTADGVLDSSFDGDGLLITDFAWEVNNDYAQRVLVQPDGKIVAAGLTQLDGEQQYAFGLARYKPDGLLDSSFNDDGLIVLGFSGSPYDMAYAMQQQADGKIVVAGLSAAQGSGTGEDFALARLTTDGFLDSSFGSGGLVTTDFYGENDEIHDLALQPDGKIVAAGLAYVTGDPEFDNLFAVARYNPDGSLDASFGNGGWVTTDFFANKNFGQAVALQPDGKILVSGTAQVSDQGYAFALARYQPDGTLDAYFGVNGLLSLDFGLSYDASYDLLLQPDGRIVLAGAAGDVVALVRYR